MYIFTEFNGRIRYVWKRQENRSSDPGVLTWHIVSEGLVMCSHIGIHYSHHIPAQCLVLTGLHSHRGYNITELKSRYWPVETQPLSIVINLWRRRFLWSQLKIERTNFIHHSILIKNLHFLICCKFGHSRCQLCASSAGRAVSALRGCQ